MRTATVLAALAAVTFFTAPAAHATDGHFLHAVGAVSSAMGGVGIAYPNSLLSTYYLNPAGLAKFDTTQIEFGFELFKADRTVSSGITFPNGFEFRGQTRSKSEYVPIPAMAFSIPVSDKVVIGLGGLGIGGFGVDYAADPTNPILLPQPFGFGQVFSNYSLLKFTPSVAWKITENLWLGANATVAWSSLSVKPAPFAPPAVSPNPDGSFSAFYSDATATDGAFGTGLGIGLTYNSDAFYFGINYQTPTWFEEFTWNTTWANPALPNYGGPREISFRLDTPAVFGIGAAFAPADFMVLELDARRLMYGSTKGFELENPDQPFDQFGAVAGFGWESIWSWSVGGQFGVSEAVYLRAGYNYSQNPVPDKLAMINVPAPAIVKSHLTLGMGLKLGGGFDLDLAYYKAFSNEGTGPLWGPQGPMPGSFVTNELSEHSLLMQFSFITGRR
jgi:long-chain fatty acid transport protein